MFLQCSQQDRGPLVLFWDREFVSNMHYWVLIGVTSAGSVKARLVEHIY